jgi:hypothetical protein
MALIFLNARSRRTVGQLSTEREPPAPTTSGFRQGS